MLKKIIIILAVLALGIAANKCLSLQKRKTAWQLLAKEIQKELGSFNGEAGIVVKDLNTGWQIALNEDKIFPSASLVKVPVMLACFYAADAKKIKLEDTLAVNKADQCAGSGILKYAPSGTRLNIVKVMELMISESDNTAANMLINYLGFDYLNRSFQKFGLKDTNICRLMMDFKERKDGKENFTSAKDMAFLLEGIYKKKLISRAYSRASLEFLRKQKIRDRIPKRLPLQVPVAHKTGLEKGVCHDAGIVFTAKGDFLICVLTRHSNKTAKPAKDFIARIAFLVYNCSIA